MSAKYMINHHIRSILPEALKRFLRALMLGITPPDKYSPEIPQHLLDSCKLLSNRYVLLSHLPKHGRVAEIGTLKGDYAREILQVCDPTELHLIDIDFRSLAKDVSSNEVVSLHQGFSHKALESFPDDYFDWIYIDGDHTYEGVKRDISVAMKKVKSGGYLVFNDFARIARAGLGTFGVHRAVCEFAAEKNWAFAYFCFNADALYDVVIQKKYN
jgi:hypothetical protein